MKERPILFSAPMVRAILEGRKTQTRRVIKPQPVSNAEGGALVPLRPSCPHGYVGDQLWVRETFRMQDFEQTGTRMNAAVEYRAGGYGPRRFDLTADEKCGWRPSIFMPRWASRITLEITDVRVQRVQEISEEDALAEGADLDSDGFPTGTPPLDDGYDTATEWFADLWDSINAKRGFAWDQNPWVWALTFRRIP